MILRFMDGPRSGKTITINRDDFTIGRDDSCDLLLDEDGVSRLHCRIERKDEAYTLKDNESTNGVRINGTKIANAQILKQNDTIRIGDTLLLFSSDENKLDSKVLASLASAARDAKEDDDKPKPSKDDVKAPEPEKEDDSDKEPADDSGSKVSEKEAGTEPEPEKTPHSDVKDATQSPSTDPGETQDRALAGDESGDVELNFNKKSPEAKKDDGGAPAQSPFGGSTGIMIAIVVLLLIILLWLIINPK